MGPIIALLFLFVAGAPLAFVVTRRALITVVLAPLVTALVCSAAGFAMLIAGGPILVWVFVLFVVEVALAWVLLGRPPLGPGARSTAGPGRGPRLARLPPVSVWDGLVLFVPLTVPALLALGSPTDWDARSIWWFHASWFAAGGSAVQAALANPAIAFAHADYPPLAPTTIAATWSLTGSTNLRVAQGVSTVLTLAAIAMLAYAVRMLCTRVSPGLARLAGLCVGATAWMLATPGVEGGTVDHLWAAALTAAAVLLLIDPDTVPRDRDRVAAPPGELDLLDGGRAKLVIGVILALVAALTKNEGFFATVLLAALFTARARHHLRVAWPAWIPVAAGLGWTVLAHARGAASDLAGSPRIAQLEARDFTPFERAHPTITAITDLLGPYLLVSAVITVVGTIFLHRVRRRTGMASSAWLCALVLAYLGALVMTYVVSPADLAWHLATSLERVCVAVVMLLAANTASWFLTAVSQPGGARAGTRGPVAIEVPDLLPAADRPGSNVGVDGPEPASTA